MNLNNAGAQVNQSGAKRPRSRSFRNAGTARGRLAFWSTVIICRFHQQTKVTLVASRVFLLLLLGWVAFGCASHSTRTSFASQAQLPAQASLPDPLQLQDGRAVTSARQWERERKPELKAMFAHYMYGAIPAKPAQTHITKLGEYADFLDGQALLKLIRIDTGPANAPKIDLMLVLPRSASGPVPVFLAMNFCGNHALTPDPRVPLARPWLGAGCAGCVDHHATDAARGAQATNWPLAEIVRRGYGFASFYNGDIDPDRAEVSEGLYAAWPRDAGNDPTNRGTIAAWAWGFQRGVDYLVTDRAIDSKRIASVGHSRNGKTALLAAAYDDRIAMAFPHQAGCGGTAPSRGKIGESVKAINDRFPHWFNAEFKTFNDAPERLPFDQHELVALCAPRPVLFSCAEGDQWSNPAGQFDVLRAANRVYALFGMKGITVESMPAPGHLAAEGRLGYYLREGKHSMTAGDWMVFLDFADLQWKRGK